MVTNYNKLVRDKIPRMVMIGGNAAKYVRMGDNHNHKRNTKADLEIEYLCSTNNKSQLIVTG